MDGKEYLSQISETNKPKRSAGSSGSSGIMGVLKSKYFLIGVGALAAFVLIMIIGNIISSSKGSIEDDCVALQLHISNTIEVLDDYQENIKDSKLRSDATSLSGILSNTNSSLTAYLEEKYDYKESKADDDLEETAELNAEELSNELFEAKINGILDRILARKMAYEIEMFVAEEESIYRATSDETLKVLLEESYGSLENLYDNFNDFTEGA